MLIELHLYPAERLALAEYLKRHLARIFVLDTSKLTVELLVLQEYVKQRSTWSTGAWRRKQPNKRFRFKLKLSVAKVLHQLMRQTPLYVFEQAFFSALNLALVNFDKHSIGIHDVLLSQLPDFLNSLRDNDLSRLGSSILLDQ